MTRKVLSEMAGLTPSKAGFSMPAEWSSHSTCYISWPCKERTWHGHFDRAKAAYADVIRAVGRFEPVTVLATPSTMNEAREALGPGVDLVAVELNDSWIRDNGPIFVRNEEDRLAIVKFGFNAWGNKYPPYDADDFVPVTLAKLLRMRHYVAPMILEGGSISVDGEGTLLTTEQCLLNPNRNPHLAREQIERTLADYLGIRKVIWLGKGVEEDLTDGHVDGVAGFVSPRVVLAAHTKDPSDPNFATLEDNIARLESATDAKGRSIEVIRMVQPRPREVDGFPITPGYTNHYIANGGVVVPMYGIPEDERAVGILRSAYPGREVVGVNCSYIEIGGGAVHCITQQRPTGVPASPLRQ
jgi:agmatine deiminase